MIDEGQLTLEPVCRANFHLLLLGQETLHYDSSRQKYEEYNSLLTVKRVFGAQKR